MCFHAQQTKSAKALKNRFKVNFNAENLYTPALYNGFQFPKTPIITNVEPDNIQLFNWGLIPSWAKDQGIRQFTLNARVETLEEKASFKNILNNRCLILADGFYEWKWLDAKGKKKQKYLLTKKGKETFAFAGLWSEWVDKQTGELIQTYTIITTEAKGIMREVHNSKFRMPVIIQEGMESNWLKGEQLKINFDDLLASAIE